MCHLSFILVFVATKSYISAEQQANGGPSKVEADGQLEVSVAISGKGEDEVLRQKMHSPFNAPSKSHFGATLLFLSALSIRPSHPVHLLGPLHPYTLPGCQGLLLWTSRQTAWSSGLSQTDRRPVQHGAPSLPCLALSPWLMLAVLMSGELCFE